MWLYEKKLQYPVKIKKPNAAFAKIIISQLGGPYCKRLYRKKEAVTPNTVTASFYYFIQWK